MIYVMTVEQCSASKLVGGSNTHSTVSALNIQHCMAIGIECTTSILLQIQIVESASLVIYLTVYQLLCLQNNVKAN
jgi:hypothetical protein